jgi:hypothetical protein
LPIELTEAEAHKYEMRWFKTRLDDPSLLDRAVTVEGLLAVPVGGKRRGGDLQLADVESCDRAIAELTGREGFPRPRYKYDHEPADESNDDEEWHLVCWGDELVTISRHASDAAWTQADIAYGRYFGYSEAAIRRYVGKH